MISGGRFFLALLSYGLAEGLWLWLSLPSIYGPAYTKIGCGNPPAYNALWGIPAYAVIATGVASLVLAPSQTRPGANARSLAFALAVYGVYNATMLATLDGYGVATAVVDTLWGMFSIGLLTNVAFVARARA